MPIASIDDTFTTPDDSGSYHGREASPAVVNSNESLAHMDSMNGSLSPLNSFHFLIIT